MSNRQQPAAGRIRGLAVRLALCCLPGLLAAAPAVEYEQIADGVFLRRGVQAEATPDNAGHIANVGFIRGSRSIAVIDAGGSLAEGRALLAAIRRHSALPISHLVITHMHPDHSLGAPVFAAEGAQVVGHAQLADALLRRQAYYLQRQAEQLGAPADATAIRIDQPVADRLEIDLGERRLTLTAHPTAHTNNDLSVFDQRSGSLWLSDLLFVERVPVIDGSLLGWLKIPAWVQAQAPQRVVPGHGPVPDDWRQALAAQTDYLQALAEDVRGLLRRRVRLGEALAAADLSQRDRWLLFDAYHGRNLTAAYVELEWE